MQYESNHLQNLTINPLKSCSSSISIALFRLVLILVLAMWVGGCSFVVFEYRASVEPVEALAYADAYTMWLSLQPPIGEIPDGGLSIPFIGAVNSAGILQTILQASEAIQDAKEITLGTAGDPASMATLYAHTPVKVHVEKRLFRINLRKELPNDR